MKKKSLLRNLIISMLVVIAAMAVFSQSAGETDTIIPVGDPDAKAPEITAKAAAIYSLQLDRQVYGKNDDEAIDPYSITKVLTCYLALENLFPEDVVTISADATRVYENGTTIYLKEGERITVRDLIYGALLASGNDAAYALGEAVSGSEKEFAELMNKTAEEWGCTNTHFVNANGWKNDDHYTTAHDMAIIAKNCFANETLLKMSNEKEYTIPATNLTSERQLENVMRSATTKIRGITGGKTGSWSDDDCTIILEYSREGLKAALVILGDTKKARKADIKTLMKFSNVVTPGFMVSDEGSIVASARVKHGRETKVDLAVDGRTLAYPAKNRTKDIRIDTEVDKLEAPLAKGDPAGKYIVYVDGEKIAEHGLVVAEDVATGWLPSYLYISNRATIVILCVTAMLIAAVILLRSYNKRNREKRRAALRQKQHERREAMIAEIARMQEDEAPQNKNEQ